MGYGIILLEDVKKTGLIIRTNMYEIINSEDIGFKTSLKSCKDPFINKYNLPLFKNPPNSFILDEDQMKFILHLWYHYSHIDCSRYKFELLQVLF